VLKAVIFKGFVENKLNMTENNKMF